MFISASLLHLSPLRKTYLNLKRIYPISLLQQAHFPSLRKEIRQSQVTFLGKIRFQIIRSELETSIIVHKPYIKGLGVRLYHQFCCEILGEKKLQLTEGALQSLIQICSITRGLSFHALRQLYLSCVILILDYGSVLWYKKKWCRNVFHMRDKLQNQALSIITSPSINSASKALEVEGVLLPTRVRHLKHASYHSFCVLKPRLAILFTQLYLLIYRRRQT